MLSKVSNHERTALVIRFIAVMNNFFLFFFVLLRFPFWWQFSLVALFCMIEVVESAVISGIIQGA